MLRCILLCSLFESFPSYAQKAFDGLQLTFLSIRWNLKVNFRYIYLGILRLDYLAVQGARICDLELVAATLGLSLSNRLQLTIPKRIKQE